MKNFLKIIICSFIVATFFSCEEDGFNENGIGSIKGVVVEEGDNTPLANVKITSVPATNTVFSDENGNFLIEDVAAGEYSVQADLDDYVAQFEAVNVTDQTVSNVVFELVKSNANNRPPLAPTLIYPPDNSTELGFTVEFLWSSTDPDDDDITYTLELRNGATDAMEIYEVGQDTSLVVNNLEIATNYFWQVTAADELNEPVASSISEFSTITELGNPFLFVKKVDGNNVIYSGSEAMDEIDFNLIPLTGSNTNSFRPRRNLTVEKIAFLRTVGGNTQLFTMNFDGTDVLQVTANVPVSGFRDDQLNFTWAQDGQLLYYPHFDKIYQIDADGGGSTVIYQTPDGSIISELDVPQFDDDLMVVKTNNVNGYDVRIFTMRMSTGAEEVVVFENTPGAVGSVSFDANADRVIYSWDVTSSQNPNYRIFESRIFIFDVHAMTATQLETDAVTGEADFDARFLPSDGGVIFMRKTNNLNGVPHIFKTDLDENNEDVELFTEAFMPDWE